MAGGCSPLGWTEIRFIQATLMKERKISLQLLEKPNAKGQKFRKLATRENRKVSAFSRVANFLNYEKGRILYNTFVMSNFNYCPLIWIYHGKRSSNRVDRVQKRALRILHNDFSLPFEVLLARSDERKLHTKNLQN